MGVMTLDSNCWTAGYSRAARSSVCGPCDAASRSPASRRRPRRPCVGSAEDFQLRQKGILELAIGRIAGTPRLKRLELALGHAGHVDAVLAHHDRTQRHKPLLLADAERAAELDHG